MSKIVEIEVTIHQETEKAWLVETIVTKQPKWVPKRMVELELEEEFGGFIRVDGIMKLPEWLAIREKLI